MSLLQAKNMIVCGRSEEVLQKVQPESVDLVVTSPPYYNAREYVHYDSYQTYLEHMRLVIRLCHQVLKEGRFFVINVSPILVPRKRRSESSKRLALPFDLHRIFVEEGYDFIDDIVWLKPEHIGWQTRRGKIFAANRVPLQYKTMPITENILVYRKQTQKLIEWNIRQYPKDIIEQSKVLGDYDKFNIWRMPTAQSKVHPAVFPLELPRKAIMYYSFVGDLVLDPFAGIGTTGKAAVQMQRRFFLIEAQPKYVQHAAHELLSMVPHSDVCILGCDNMPIEQKIF